MGEARRRKLLDPNWRHSKEAWVEREIVAYSVEDCLIYCTGEILLEKAIAKAQAKYPDIVFEYKAGGMNTALNKIAPRMRGQTTEVCSGSRW